MKIDNQLIPKLYGALAEEFDRHEPYLTRQSLSEGDRQRQGFVPTNARYFIAVLENHLMMRTASVIFTVDLAEDCCTLRFYRPVTEKEHDRLVASGYAPVLRSNTYLSVGLGRSGCGVLYAWAAVKLSQNSSVIDLLDALFLLGKELEKFLQSEGYRDGC